MLVVERDLATVPPRFRLKGVIDETTSLKSALAETTKNANLYCKDVSRINSLGVKEWKNYFTAYRDGGGAPLFFELSPVLVGAMNTVVNFIMKQEVMSVCAPFICNACEKASVKIVSASDAAAFVQSDLRMPCPFCGEVAEFDDLPKSYFSLLLG